MERRRCLGGVCVETGTIPSKTFREAVQWFAALKRRGRPERPSVSELLARVEQVTRREQEVIDDQLRRNDITVIRGEASFMGPHTIAVTSELGVRTVSGTSFVVAVGTTPAPPPGVPADGEVVITSDDVVRLSGLPRTLAVVGGGVIGIEYASMFAALGVQVTLVERRERPLEFADHEIVDELIHQMRAHHVTFRLGEAVASIEVTSARPRSAVLVLESGKRIVADMVLFSVGRVAATASLRLEAAGLAGDDRGRLAVDESFRTAVPHIYAAGDVIGYPSLAATSSEQGRLAACHALGVKTGPMARHFPVGIYAMPELSMVGDASTASEIDSAFAVLAQRHIGAVFVNADPLYTVNVKKIVALAARHAMLTVTSTEGFAADGGLISYGTSINEANRQLGVYTGRVLKGTRPGDLPVVQSTKFQLVINLKTAKALGLTIPPSLLARADELIE